jgi:hypothetical protein
VRGGSWTRRSRGGGDERRLRDGGWGLVEVWRLWKKERMVVSAGWPWGEARSGLSK